MSDSPDSVAIAGGGLGGFSVAQELRRRGFAGAITIVDPEGTPYDRPPLSKEYLDGRFPGDKLPFVPDSWYAEHAVAVVTDVVAGVSEDARTITLGSGAQLTSDVLVLATGGRARTLPIPGGDLPGLRYLRTKADADTLNGFLEPGKHLAIVGAGLIGAEVASTAVNAGAEVTLIDPFEVPGIGVMGETIARYLHGLHADHGVHTLRASTSAIETDGQQWTVTVDGQDGQRVQVVADAVLVAIGIMPDLSLAEPLGLDVDNGILVDAHRRTTHPRVYAVGDSSRRRFADGSVSHRHEHWESAMRSGQTAAAAILGQDLPVHPAPWMWSDRYSHHVEAVGSMIGGRHVLRERDGKPWVAFVLEEDGRLRGAAAIDGGHAIRAARRIIDRGIVVDPEKLADPSLDLKKLAR